MNSELDSKTLEMIEEFAKLINEFKELSKKLDLFKGKWYVLQEKDNLS